MPSKPIFKQALGCFLILQSLILSTPTFCSSKPHPFNNYLSTGTSFFQNDNDVYLYVDVAPQFPGGQPALYKFINKNLQYPQKAIERNQQGIVKLYFVVRKDGSVDKIQVIKSAGALLDKEAIRLLKSMPRWKPGYRHGKPVNAQHSLPISFKLVYS
jgi:protein TonB